MTVKELIKDLEELPKDAVVVLLDGMPIEGVEIAESRTIQSEIEAVIY